MYWLANDWSYDELSSTEFGCVTNVFYETRRVKHNLEQLDVWVCVLCVGNDISEVRRNTKIQLD